MSEKELRKRESLCGSWVLLGDGEKWCVPSLPLGGKRDELIKKFESLLDTITKVSGPNAAGKLSNDLFASSLDFCTSLLRHNYPNLDDEHVSKSDLITMQHVKVFMQVFQGEKDLGAVIGVEKNPGLEAAKIVGEAMARRG